MRFLELKGNLKKDFSGHRKARLALLGDSATQLLAQALRGAGYEAGHDLQVYDADYNQIDRQVLLQSSELYQFAPEYVLLFQSAQKLIKRFYNLAPADRKNFAQSEVAHINQLLDHLTANAPSAKLILANYMETNDTVFGQYANKTESSFLYQVRQLNCRLMAVAQERKNLFICDIAAQTAAFGQNGAVDNRNYVEADMAFGLDFLPIMAKAVVDIVHATSGGARKCLILDLDNTMWGGIIGDDGVENIQLGDLDGKAFTELQYWARELKNRGVLLAVCSKNEEAIAKKPFQEHPDMVLALEDFSIFVANWDSKVDNIRKIKEFLNIGYDSMVFVDDNAYERGVVKHHLPDITIPDLPVDSSDYLAFLRGLNLFETSSVTEEDAQRTEHFILEAKRETIQRSFTDEGEFLANLHMTGEVSPFNAFNIPRAAQLIQRSNQFNLRTIRYSEADLAGIAASPLHQSWTFNVADRFGGYGIISVVIGVMQGDALFLDTWVMSCRVLRRGVENLALNEIAEGARRAGARRLRGEFLPTAKNMLVKNHYRDLGFADAGIGQWELELENFESRKHFITRTSQPG